MRAFNLDSIYRMKVKICMASLNLRGGGAVEASEGVRWDFFFSDWADFIWNDPFILCKYMPRYLKDHLVSKGCMHMNV